jgi:stage II sporulation protein D
MMNKFISTILYFLICATLSGQELDIRIFSEFKAEIIHISTRNTTYIIQVDTVYVDTVGANKNISIEIKDTCMAIKFDSTEFLGKDIFLSTEEGSDGYFINLNQLKQPARAYRGNLRVFMSERSAHIINRVPLEEYVAAVVEAEGGHKAPIEYYKTQAVICRTYALRNLHRHEEEGFHLCDLTHCQVYPGIPRNKLIIQAVQSTKGLVIVDDKFELINAVYHSNSGGYTANSADVWTSQLSYLQAVEDTFSLSGNHAQWERRISLAEWHIFLENKGVNIRSLSDEDMIKRLNQRMSALKYGQISIPMREIRQYFGLKSAYFDVILEGSEISLKGKGYGHGVGLAQEGAMAMANLGYDYQNIIKHYYLGTKVIDMKLLSVFQGMKHFNTAE